MTFRGSILVEVVRARRHWQVIVRINCAPLAELVCLGQRHATEAGAEASLDTHTALVVTALDEAGVKHNAAEALR